MPQLDPALSFRSCLFPPSPWGLPSGQFHAFLPSQPTFPDSASSESVVDLETEPSFLLSFRPSKGPHDLFFETGR